jgi:molecular chaperone GrpE (heat shock protein)
MGLTNLSWFRRKGKEQTKDKEEAQRLVLEELQGLKKLLRKQSMQIEEVHREQEALAAKEPQNMEPLLDLCDAVFYLERAFHNPGLMSRQHAQVLKMVLQKADRFAASFGLKMILEEGMPFDPQQHEAVANRSPGAHPLQVIEVIRPGYLRDDKVLRPAKVVVGALNDPSITPEGSTRS